MPKKSDLAVELGRLVDLYEKNTGEKPGLLMMTPVMFNEYVDFAISVRGPCGVRPPGQMVPISFRGIPVSWNNEVPPGVVYALKTEQPIDSTVWEDADAEEE